VGIGQARQRERLAGRHRARAVAAVEHRVPAAPGQRRGQSLVAVGVLVVHPPAGVGEHVGEHRRVRGRHVDQQGAQ
jgi:hypothetical protein